MPNRIKWFKEISKDDIEIVGGKGANLGEMTKAGLPIPPGFVVTAQTYKEFIEKSRIKNKILDMVKDLDIEDTAKLQETAKNIQRLIESTEIPKKIQKGIKENYTLIGTHERSEADEIMQGKEEFVACRSSATAEDLPSASFAGQQATFLNVKGKEDCVKAVRKCWASLFTARAIYYRAKNNFPTEKVFIAVVVQKMVNSKAAGVMFTLNPINGDVSKVVIEGSWGLGETVVSGSVNPDKFTVDKVLLEINERTISTKQIECFYDPDREEVVHAEVLPERQCECCLDDTEIKKLVTTAKTIESYYGCPQDIEWAIDKDLPFPKNIFIVQSRPETVWSQRKMEPIIGKKSGYQLLMEKAMSRITLR